MNLQKTKDLMKVRCNTPTRGLIPDFCETKIVNCRSVVEGLKNEMDTLSCKNPIMADAGTGVGKTTWVYRECIPRAIQAGKNTLLVGNRHALSHQQKSQIMEVINSPKRDCLTEKGIKEESDFGSVRVITYHKLPEFIKNESNKEWISNLMYVVFDEAHFFVADSQFNDLCDYYLKIATSRFCHAIRVYLTATSWDVLYPIAVAEQKNYLRLGFQNCWEAPRTFTRYYFPRNFDRYKLNFFTSLAELQNLIRNSGEEKWLIFVDNKEKGKEILSMFETEAEYIDAESKTSKAWKTILSHEYFNSKILVSTAVLDCGVNIKDLALKNIAVITDNRTSMMQMIGRKRLMGNESVNVWVYDIPINSIKRRYNEIGKLMEWFEAYDRTKDNLEENQKLAREIWRSGNLKLYKLFNISCNRLYVNELARFQLERNLVFMEEIIEGKTTFKSSVYQWLEKKEEPAMSSLEALCEYCKAHARKQLNENECDKLRKLIVTAYENHVNKEVQHTRKDSLKERALNNRLIKLDVPYEIINTGKQWFIQEIEEEL